MNHRLNPEGPQRVAILEMQLKAVRAAEDQLERELEHLQPNLFTPPTRIFRLTPLDYEPLGGLSESGRQKVNMLLAYDDHMSSASNMDERLSIARKWWNARQVSDIARDFMLSTGKSRQYVKPPSRRRAPRRQASRQATPHDALHDGKRRLMFEMIRVHPGVQVRELSDMLRRGISAVRRDLRVLARVGLVIVNRRAHRYCCWAVPAGGALDPGLVAAASDARARTTKARSSKCRSARIIAKKTGLRHGVVSYHLKSSKRAAPRRAGPLAQNG